MNFESKFLHVADKLPQHHSSSFKNLGIVIEWPKGSVRTGKDKNGKKWSRKMEADYGYIPDTAAAGDKEGLDVYIGPNEQSEKVFVVEQLTDDGEFDEYKCLLGFDDLDTAFETYLKHYPDDWEDNNVAEVYEVPFHHLFDAVEEHQEESKTAARLLSKTSPINENGWLCPDGRFLPSGRDEHIDAIRKILPIQRSITWDDIYSEGYIRVSIQPINAFLETSEPMTKELYARLLQAAKRVSASVLYAWVGIGETFEKYKWDGRQFTRYVDRKVANTGFTNINGKISGIAYLKALTVMRHL